MAANRWTYQGSVQGVVTFPDWPEYEGGFTGGEDVHAYRSFRSADAAMDWVRKVLDGKAEALGWEPNNDLPTSNYDGPLWEYGDVDAHNEYLYQLSDDDDSIVYKKRWTTAHNDRNWYVCVQTGDKWDTDRVHRTDPIVDEVGK